MNTKIILAITLIAVGCGQGSTKKQAANEPAVNERIEKTEYGYRVEKGFPED